MTKYAQIEASRASRGAWTPGTPGDMPAERRMVRTYQDTKWAVVLMSKSGSSFEVIRDRLTFEDADRIAYKAGGRHRAMVLRTKASRVMGYVP